jgi:hypothetical protein
MGSRLSGIHKSLYQKRCTESSDEFIGPILQIFCQSYLATISGGVILDPTRRSRRQLRVGERMRGSSSTFVMVNALLTIRLKLSAKTNTISNIFP